MSRKRIILMYITEVSGHHSATLAIEKAIKKSDPQAEVLNINAFNYTNPISEKIINRIYLSVIKRAPAIWDYLYDNQQVVKKIGNLKEFVHRLNSPKLKNLFDRFKPDIVACTQAFPCGMVADFKKAYNSDLPLVAVLTDYIPHSYWVYDAINYYITPSDEITERLIKKGAPPHKIKPLGIPFDHRFNEPVDKPAVMQKMNLIPRLPTILIMGGGQGLGPIKTIINSLEKTGIELQEIAITGTNRKLYACLKRNIKKYKKIIRLFGYANNINELMSVADIIITKPGGVTTAEVLAKAIPMIIVRPIPGQETNNTAYLTKNGAAIKIDKTAEIGAIIERLVRNRGRMEEMSLAAKRISKPNASTDIAGLILSCAGRRNG